MAQRTVNGWTRTHRNGHMADVREWPDRQYFSATAWPPPGEATGGSLPFSVERTIDDARNLADARAHSDCPGAEECAGAWMPYTMTITVP